MKHRHHHRRLNTRKPARHRLQRPSTMTLALARAHRLNIRRCRRHLVARAVMRTLMRTRTRPYRPYFVRREARVSKVTRCNRPRLTRPRIGLLSPLLHRRPPPRTIIHMHTRKITTSTSRVSNEHRSSIIIILARRETNQSRHRLSQIRSIAISMIHVRHPLLSVPQSRLSPVRRRRRSPTIIRLSPLLTRITGGRDSSNRRSRRRRLGKPYVR